VSGLVAVLDELRDVVAEAYADGDLDIQVERRWVPQPTSPCIDIYPGDPLRDESTANFDDELGNPGFSLTVRTRIAGDYDAAYDWLLETMDEESDLCLPLLLLEDSTLNGLAMDVDVRDASGLRFYQDLQGAFLGWQFTALVFVAHS
jgi:hypothetical protein